MMNRKISGYVGNTPMIKLSSKTNKYSQKGINIYIKLENLNPTGSIKDRMVQYILDDAIKTGKIQPGGTVVEASSGNTATSLSMFCALYDLKAVLFTNTNCSVEKVNHIKSYGATTLHILPLCSKTLPQHYQNVALNYSKEHPSYFHFNQYENPKNAESYYNTLGPEIWDNTQGQINVFVASGGTCGTITGIGSFLKSKNKDIKIIMADVSGSIFFNKRNNINIIEKFTLIEGVGKVDIPQVMNLDVIDDILKIEDEEAFSMCHILEKNEGIHAGGSGGCNVFASLKLAKLLAENIVSDQVINIITLIPDSGLKYMSKIYNPTWLQDNDIILAQ